MAPHRVRRIATCQNCRFCRDFNSHCRSHSNCNLSLSCRACRWTPRSGRPASAPLRSGAWSSWSAARWTGERTAPPPSTSWTACCAWPTWAAAATAHSPTAAGPRPACAAWRSTSSSRLSQVGCLPSQALHVRLMLSNPLSVAGHHAPASHLCITLLKPRCFRHMWPC